MKYLLSISIVLLCVNPINAQVQLQNYIDVGEHSVSEGLFVKNVLRGYYRYHTYSVEAGTQFDLKSSNPNFLTGVDIIGTKSFLIKEFPVDLNGFFMLNRFSDLMYETNWGIRVGTSGYEHFVFALGTNFKTYTVTSSAIEEYEVDESDSKLSENFNLVYIITVCLKPNDNYWNAGLSCTNIDYYIINQSTNPVFNLHMSYKFKSNLTLRLESWYKQAGVFNINANHFAYFFRGSITWEI